MKYFVQETRSSLIKNYLFANNDVTIQWLPLSEKFVHKANCYPLQILFYLSIQEWLAQWNDWVEHHIGYHK